MRPVVRAALLLAALQPACATAQLAGRAVEPLPALAPAVEATGFAGTVVVHDLRRDRLAATHPALVDAPRIPASTFKIANALIAVENGIVEDARTVIRWDGVERPRTELNRDLDLATAFRLSAVPHFQWIAREVGEARMRRSLEALGYGNADVGGGIDRFWLTGDLRVTPRQQIEFLARLHRGDLPLAPRTMEVVRGIMEVERTDAYTIRAKTGWAELPDGHAVGWWVGWVERGEEVYFFASMLEADRPGDAFGPARLEAARAVLRGLGALPPAE